MNYRTKDRELVKRLCDLLGRQHFAARFLDQIAQWIAPTTLRPLLHGAGATPAGLNSRQQPESQDLGTEPMLMAALAPGSPDPARGMAPSTRTRRMREDPLTGQGSGRGYSAAAATTAGGKQLPTSNMP